MSGSVDIYPDQDITYVLTASGFIGNVPGTTNCSLTLTVTPVQLTEFTISPAQIIAEQGGINAATLNWSAQAQVLSLDNGIGSVIGSTSYELTAPADQTVYILSAGTFQNPGLYALTVTVQNGWGPFQGTIVPIDTLNIPIPASPYQAFIQEEMDWVSVFPLPAAYASLLPTTYYILEIDGATGDSGAENFSSTDPVLAGQLTPGRYLGYFDVYQNTIYGQQISVPFFVIIVKFDTVADYPVTIKIITITPALS